MARELRNMGASVRARLLDRSRREGADFQNLLTRYALERLLYRLSVSAERDRFVLKGAMLFATWLDDPFRPTGDLDLLGLGDDEVARIADTFRAICIIEVSDDGVLFDVDGLRATATRDGADYGGVRVRTSAAIGGARVPIQVDIGFGDAITPHAIEIDYPTLLDAPAPHLRAYPAETVIAEKFEALVGLGLANTRMKDFYDLWLISRTFSFTGAALREAVHRTFERRRREIPADVPKGLSGNFARDKGQQWRAFLGRERMAPAPEDFDRVIDDLRSFLLSPLVQDRPSAYLWSPSGSWRELAVSDGKDDQTAVDKSRS